MLNSEFLDFLFGFVEKEEESDSCLKAAMKVLIAFNLHFSDPESNFLIHCLNSQESSKNFSERLLLLFNDKESTVPILVLLILQLLLSDTIPG